MQKSRKKYKICWLYQIKYIQYILRISYQQMMNKFNKKLTISLPQEPSYSHQNQSPSIPESVTHDKESLLQFRQFRDGGDSQYGDIRNQAQTSKLNFVQFEQFNVNNYQVKDKRVNEDQKKLNNHYKRNVIIEVPDRDQEKMDDRKFKANRISDNYMTSTYEEDKFKEPPAPSKGSKFSKVFVFPNTPPLKKQEKSKEKDTSESKQQLKRSFQRQRQQFYKQKSRLQKEILIKNGQIQMLHKLLTENFSATNQRPTKTSQHHEYNNNGYQNVQQILLQKDLQINELLEKINQLNNLLSRKSEQYGKKIIELSSAQALIQSLKNQIYIYQRKDSSDKLTKKFYQMQKEKPKEQPEQFSIVHGNKQFGSKGLESLYKRIQMVRMNRLEFDSRNKIKSDVTYSQTAKNRPKGVFDFKGKTFEANTNLNKTKMY